MDLSPLQPYATALGLTLPCGALARLAGLIEFLLEVNARTNLTAVTDPDEILDRHLSDSLAIATLVPKTEGGVVDLGSGGGFPGLPMALALPGRRFTLVETRSRKAAFLREAVRVMELTNVEVVEARAEDLGRDPLHRERHAVAVARAFAPLPALLECALPLVAVGGTLVAPRGADAGAQLRAARGVERLLGGREESVKRYRLLSGLELEAVLFSKTDPTPERYPRRAGVPERRPLGCGSCGKLCG